MHSAADLHMHSEFSCDGEASVEAMCRAAVVQGLREIAITDHADFTPHDVCCGYLRPAAQWRAVERARTTFAQQLVVRAGLEIGEPHRYPSETRALVESRPYDVILGSLHWVDDRPTFDGSFFRDEGLRRGLGLYVDELHRLAAAGSYDVLGHLDIIRRATSQRFGLGELDWAPFEQGIRRVLRAVAQRGKALELNTGYERKGLGAPGPPIEILRWYREEGGAMITLGSDAHAPSEIGADFTRGAAMLRAAGFTELTTFARRSPSFIPLPGIGEARP